MRGGARVLPGVRCFRGAAVFGVGGAAVFGVGGAAAVLGGAGAFAALVFLTAARKTGARRRFWAARRGGLRNLSAALSLRSVRRPLFRRRSRSARFAAVFCAGLCTVFCGSHSACRTLRRTFMPGARPNY